MNSKKIYGLAKKLAVPLAISGAIVAATPQNVGIEERMEEPVSTIGDSFRDSITLNTDSYFDSFYKARVGEILMDPHLRNDLKTRFEKTSRYENFIVKQNLHPNLVYSIIAVESGGNPNARSRTGPRGLMQTTRAISMNFGDEHCNRNYDLRNKPENSINAGTSYIEHLGEKWKRFNPSFEHILTLYNRGETEISKKIGMRNFLSLKGKDLHNFLNDNYPTLLNGYIMTAGASKKILDENLLSFRILHGVTPKS